MIRNYGHITTAAAYYFEPIAATGFALMVSCLKKMVYAVARRYLDHSKMEYTFWMDCRIVDPNQAYRHVVRMPDGSLLNRYWDDRDTPRDESRLEDVEAAKKRFWC